MQSLENLIHQGPLANLKYNPIYSKQYHPANSFWAGHLSKANFDK